MSVPLRNRLLISFLLVAAVTGCVIAAVGMKLLDNAAAHQARDEVDQDVKMALQLQQSKQDEIRTALAFTAIRPVTVRRALVERDWQTLGESLAKVKTETGLDVLGVTDAAGRVLLRSGSGRTGDDLSTDDLIAGVLQAEKPVACTGIWNAERLQRELPEAAASVHVVAGADNAARRRSGKDGSLWLAAAAPILSDTGETLGVLYGGNLLDGECSRRKCPLVDFMRDTIFHDAEHPGIVAILRGDEAVSASLTDSSGGRIMYALGGGISSSEGNRRVSSNEGSRRHERYLAAGEWYIGASEPVRDLHGASVATIRVGVREKEYADARRKAIAFFSCITIGAMIAAMAVAFARAAAILRPLRRLSEGARQLAAGDLDHRVSIDPRDPLATLADTFNGMADSIRERDERIKEDTREMMEARRLATLGQLAAGVAHEINNPLGGIMVYSHLLLEDLPADDPHAANVRKMIREADRCKKIVKGLLDYSRQDGPQKEIADANAVLSAALNLVTQLGEFGKVTVRKNLSAQLPKVNMDVSQMEQVFANILLNAAQAMNGDGELDVSTYACNEGNRVVVSISDTGPGIAPEHLKQVFEPFFTSKQGGQGTGLGLAISHGIVKKHGGTIRAANNTTRGATFFVELPADGAKNA